VGNVHLRAYVNESEKFGCDVFVESDAAMACRAMFDPDSMNAIVRFEFTPIGHGGSDERPSWWLVRDFGLAGIAAAVCPTV